MCALAQEITPAQLCDPIDCSPPGSFDHGIFQTRISALGNELTFPSPGDLADPEMESVSLGLLLWQVGSLPTEPPGGKF